ncbi:IS3 family transposase [Enterococcus sp. BWB1-3]|uniref:IS3 family transposase n=1 Tax=unclassified Enterococcus TaxID=2608891 RepID=UPI001921BE11|nr:MULTISPECIES: IS3 family transposase [unclassified Enterococcus]MBL1227818.1 IS3 family transposase [Enterococcus sp. BWB1-3]MCB5953310.1 IS3 family transposase [Enterococcus sp. BWT-B8]
MDNQTIETILKTFQIERLLSRKGSPHDNAGTKSTYKSTNVEFIYPNTFQMLQELTFQLFAYIHWWSHLQLHGSLGLGYETPIAYRNKRLAKRILDNKQGDRLNFSYRLCQLEVIPRETRWQGYSNDELKFILYMLEQGLIFKDKRD